MLNIYSEPTAIWMSSIPPRLRLAKNTFTIAYAISITAKRSIMELDIVPSPKGLDSAASAREPRELKSLTIADPTVAKLAPAPERSRVSVPCSVTDRVYRRTGTVVNRLPAKESH